MSEDTAEPTSPTANVAADQGYGDEEQVTMSPENDPFVVTEDDGGHHPFTPPDNADAKALTQEELDDDAELA